MPPFLSSQSIVLAIHGLATPLLGYLALFDHFSSSQSIVLTIHGLATPFPWLSSSFCPIFVELVHRSGHPWTGADLLPCLWGLGPVHA